MKTRSSCKILDKLLNEELKREDLKDEEVFNEVNLLIEAADKANRLMYGEHKLNRGKYAKIN